MKKTLLIIFILFAALSLTTSSCSKEETKTPIITPTDVRDQAVGTYTYALQVNTLNSDGSITAVGSKSTGAFTVEKGTITGTIVIIEAGDVVATGSKITSANNGFAFDVDTQVQDSISLTGFDYFLLGGAVKYSGAYDSASNKLSFAYKYTNTNSGEVAVLTWECTKIK